MALQSALSQKLSFEEKKMDVVEKEHVETQSREKSAINEMMERVGQGLRGTARIMEDKKANADLSREFSMAAAKMQGSEMVDGLRGVERVFGAIENIGNLDGNPESFFEISQKIQRLINEFENIKIQSQEKGGSEEILKSIPAVIQSIQVASSYLARKGQALQAYKSMRF